MKQLNTHTNLPILQKSSDAYKLWYGFLPHAPRLSRYTLGTKIDALLLETVELIVLASYASKDQKYVLITRASGKLDLVKFFLQLAWELKMMDNKTYLAISSPLIEVGKMLGGWQRQLALKEAPAH